MLDLISVTEPGDQLPWLILALAILTFITRIGGHVIVSLFSRIPPKVHVALEAVPAAVLAALVAPAAFTNGPAEFITLLFTAIACFRLSASIIPFVALFVLVALRQMGL